MIKEKVKELWKLCFNDSEKFVEMYFRLRYKEENNLAILNGTEVTAALQMLPYPMTFCGDIVQTSYISGACTHPDFRGKGVMRELLSQSFERMYNSGVHFSTLIPAEPWLFDYYAKMGYAPVFRYSVQEITQMPQSHIKGEGEIAITPISVYREDVYSYLNKKLLERSCCIQHTQEDFNVLMEDLALSGGVLLIAQKETNINGIAVFYQTEKQLLINDLLAENGDIKQSLLHVIREYADNKKINQLLPPCSTLPIHALGMARIIHVKEVLRIYASAFPEKEMQLQIWDEQLPDNNGYYKLHKGICIFSVHPASDTCAYERVSINDISSRIFESLHPYMSLMLN